MPVEPRPGSFEIVVSGVRQLRANWQLVPVVALQSLVTVGLLLAGLLLPLAALGAGSLAWLWRLADGGTAELTGWIDGLLETGQAALVPLAVSLLAATLAWSVAFLLYCYFQAGVLGILMRGDRRAGPAGAWPAFRAFEVAEFHRLGMRLVWRYFWFNHLLGALATGWLLAAAVWVALAIDGGARVGLETAVAAGCLGLLPLAVLLAALLLWGALGSADLARDGSSVLTASRVAVRVLVHSPGAVLVVALLGLVGWLAAGAFLAPLGWGTDVAASDSWGAWVGGRAVVAVTQSLANAAVAVAVGGSLVALVRSEAEA